MTFEEVTHRLDTLPDELSHLRRMKLWQAYHGGYSWVISYEPGCEEWTEDHKKAWIGFHPSYRLEGVTGSSNTIKIDGAPFDSFTKAEQACREVWKQIRAPQ